MSLPAALIQHLEQQTGCTLQPCRIQAVSGGDINRAYQLQSAQQHWFIKCNQAERLAMFQAEAAGLQALANTGTVNTPSVITCGAFQQHSYLVLNYCALKPLRDTSARQLGQQLAQLHQIAQPWFGWPIHNTIGSTPQDNSPQSDWVRFWQQQRLGPQLHRAAQQGYNGALQQYGQQLLECVGGFFSNYHPQPSLLHGDLWGGNAAANSQGQPMLFDPACYYGDREADIAMTQLFGGFPPDFYAAYTAHWPLDAGYRVRQTLYNLYHILNHLNLFGRSYLSQAQGMIQQLLAELG
jgi:protein-ribulosamine 3-kinase